MVPISSNLCKGQLYFIRDYKIAIFPMLLFFPHWLTGILCKGLLSLTRSISLSWLVFKLRHDKCMFFSSMPVFRIRSWNPWYSPSIHFLTLSLSFFFFCHTSASKILALGPGIEPCWAVKALNPEHWTSKKGPNFLRMNSLYLDFELTQLETFPSNRGIYWFVITLSVFGSVFRLLMFCWFLSLTVAM